MLVRDVQLRVERLADGRFPLADLFRSSPRSPEDPAGAGTSAREQGEVAFHLADGRVSVLDEKSGTRVEFREIKAEGTWRPRRVVIRTMNGTVNGGTFAFDAELDRMPNGAGFEGELQLREVAPGEGIHALAYLVPVLHGVPACVDGKLNLDLYLRGRGDTNDALRRSLIGQGSLTLEPVVLSGSRMIGELADLAHLPPEAKVGAVRCDVALAGGRVSSQELCLEVAGLPIVLSGWTDPSGRIDYRVRAESLTGQIPQKVESLLADLDVNVQELLSMRVQGTLDDPVVTIDGVPLDGRDPARIASERQRLHDLGRRLRDRLFR